MRQNEYPIPSCTDKDVEEQEDGWVEVSLKEIDGRRSKVYAVDCEMVITMYTLYFICLIIDILVPD